MALILFPFLGSAKADIDTLVFKVSGNCEMCKERIEYAVDVKGVKSANWDQESKMITVVYDKSKITEDKIHQLIAKAGYETSKTPADQDAYKGLPGCCQYDQTQHKPKKSEAKP